MSSEANDRHSERDPADACQSAKAEDEALKKLKKDKERAKDMINLILQRAAMHPGEVIEVILPDHLDDHLDEDDYVEDDEFLCDDGTPDLSKMLPNSDNNPIEYIYTRDASGRVMHVDACYKQARGNGK
jgi:hypothetical protein